MAWGTIQIGRLTLVEVHSMSEQIDAGTGEKTISLDGREFAWRYGALDDFAAVARRQEDLLGLADSFVSVVFANKSEQNGYYRVHDVNASNTKWVNEQSFFDWSMILRKLGPDNAVDIESRVGSVIRSNNFVLAGERWHAPSIGHYGYYTGGTLPSVMTRTGESGVITVYRAVPASVNPRWGCSVAAYPAGRVRLLTDGYERNGTAIRATPTGWELNNGLVRVRPLPSGGMLEVAAWGGAAWETKAWNVARGGATTALGTFDAVTVVRNDFELVTLRLVRSDSPGRAMVDLTLRRGSRLLELYVQTSVASTLGLYLQTTETASDQTATGYVVASGDDPQGNRFIVGSAKTVSYTSNQGISKASAIVFDGYIGAVFNGAAAVAGDGATALRDQYIGALSESTAVVRR